MYLLSFWALLDGSILQQKNLITAKDFIALARVHVDDCGHGKA
jgi:hypothetical protein